ncbi:MAG: TetR/AcrR family transcriptional regulator [Sphingomonadaceae bacterium]
MINSRHEARRREIADIVCGLVADLGIEGVTIRDIAREAGYSTTIISHYFRNKKDLLVFTVKESRLRSQRRVEEAAAAGGNLQTCLEEFLPLDRLRLAEWRTWFGFWGSAKNDPDIAAERLTAQQESHHLIVNLLETERARGKLPKSLDCEYHATRLQAVINGLAGLVTMDPDAWSPRRLRSMVAWEVRMMRKYNADDE